VSPGSGLGSGYSRLLPFPECSLVATFKVHWIFKAKEKKKQQEISKQEAQV
jgi:hypothetical protein